jgi:hypothetical protein
MADAMDMMETTLIDFRGDGVWVSDCATRLLACDDNGTYEMAFLHKASQNQDAIRWLKDRMIPVYLGRDHLEWLFARIIDPVAAFEARTRWT